ncbi:MAG TPA: NADH-quinone oxidoreductase subunit M, partial [Anaerolineae bacterium]|nr:NADH-quinone oxidoreductase subunit M [Anaerolineae bacterium]
MNSTFPFLTLITFIPAVTGAIILLMPKERGTLIKVTAAVATLISAVLAFTIFITYDKTVGGYQFIEGPYPWVSSLGINYLVGADGINLVMLILTGIVSFMGVLISWGIN